MHRFQATLFSALFATSAAFASAGESFDLNTLDPETLAALRAAYAGASDEWLAQNIRNIYHRQKETKPGAIPLVLDSSSPLFSFDPGTVVTYRQDYPHATDAWLARKIEADSGLFALMATTLAPGLSAEDQERVSTLMSQYFEGTFSGGQSAITPTEETPAPVSESTLDVPWHIPSAPALPLTLPSLASISALPAAASFTFEEEIANRARSNANEHAVAVDILNTPGFRAWLEASGMADEWASLTEASRLHMAEIYRTSL